MQRIIQRYFNIITRVRDMEGNIVPFQTYESKPLNWYHFETY